MANLVIPKAIYFSFLGDSSTQSIFGSTFGTPLKSNEEKQPTTNGFNFNFSNSGNNKIFSNANLTTNNSHNQDDQNGDNNKPLLSLFDNNKAAPSTLTETKP